MNWDPTFRSEKEARGVLYQTYFMCTFLLLICCLKYFCQPTFKLCFATDFSMTPTVVYAPCESCIFPDKLREIFLAGPFFTKPYFMQDTPQSYSISCLLHLLATESAQINQGYDG